MVTLGRGGTMYFTEGEDTAALKKDRHVVVYGLWNSVKTVEESKD
ncbi:hypothetical protein GCM10028791_33190 [Echinicola sediminis]